MSGEENVASERLAVIRARIAKAAARFGPPPERVDLVAVSKTVPAAGVLPYLTAGQRIFGENRVQESQAKWPQLKADFPDVRLHLIGPLQTNKVREAVELFDVIETLDRDKLASALRKEFERVGKRPQLFVQVNIGNEPQKSGVARENAVEFVRKCVNFHGLEVVGLMGIPPAGVPAGPYFADLAQLARDAGVGMLSMGMSADFEVAIAMGATHVRVGSALFGARPPVPATQPRS